MEIEGKALFIIVLCVILGTLCLIFGIISSEIEINKYKEIYCEK